MTEFWLGVHRPGWLAIADVPLFVSRRTLLAPDGALRRRLPRAISPWALDSGGFTELFLKAGWSIDEARYSADVRRLRDEVGMLAWAAPQDWMCEPQMLAITGLDVGEHQRRTVGNLVRLREVAPDLPFVPVVQGWRLADYLRCVDLYADAGVDLAVEPRVGVGSVCRRQSTLEAEAIFEALADRGLRLHGFGVKISGLEAYADCLASADSMAWSFQARWDANHGLPSCEPERRRSCANCLHYALSWRTESVLPRLDVPPRPRQQPLWKEHPCAA